MPGMIVAFQLAEPFPNSTIIQDFNKGFSCFDKLGCLKLLLNSKATKSNMKM